MSKRISGMLVMAAFLIPMPLHAEEVDEWWRRIHVGGHLGLAFATIGGSELDDTGVDYSYRIGLSGGGSVGLRLTRVLSVQIQLDLATKGFRADTGFPSTSGTQYEAYLEFPFLLQPSLHVSEWLQLCASLGPAFGILLDQDIRFDNGQLDETDAGLKRFDIGLVLGAGAAVDWGRHGTLTLDVHYNLGLRNKLENRDLSDSKNRALYLMVGYRADLATLGRLFGRGSRQGPAEPAGAAPVAAAESDASSRR